MAKKITAALVVLFTAVTLVVYVITPPENDGLETVTFSYTLPTNEIPSAVTVVGSRFGGDWSIVCDSRYPGSMYHPNGDPRTYECKVTISQDWRKLPYNVQLEYATEDELVISSRYYVTENDERIYTWGSFAINGYSLGYPACWAPNDAGGYNVVANGC
jgi:hypothetical protein